MTIDAILFDLDGTLVQHGQVLLPDQLEIWGHPRSLETVHAAFAVQIEWFYSYTGQLMAAGREDPHLFRRLYERIALELEIDDPAVPILMDSYFSTHPAPPLFDDVRPVLAWIAEAKLPMGIITQRDREPAIRFLAEHKITGHFQVLVAGDDGHGRKPAPDPFFAALGKLSVEPEKAIYIGDRIDDDCGGARAAGLSAFLIDREQQHADKSVNADFVWLRSLIELLTYLPKGKANGHG